MKFRVCSKNAYDQGSAGRGRGKVQTPQNEEVRDDILDGDEDVRGHQFSRILGRGPPGRGPG